MPPEPVVRFRDTVLVHRRPAADGGPVEETVLDADGLSLDILPGELVAFLAKGGGEAAKGGGYRFYHELGAWLQGLRPPTRGELAVFGKPVPLAAADMARTARVFREGGLLPEYTIAQNIALALAFHGLDAAERARRLEDALDRFALCGYRNEYPGTDAVGRGAEKRANYARAWIRRPTLLFIDQPFLHIRDRYAGLVAALVDDLRAAGGAVVFTTNRDRDLAAGAAGRGDWRPDRCLTLNHGRWA